ncbi:MAG: thiamine phosphate synthase [Pikeienuella sp.]|uniref:thiamine phosphate synthase n=1 Tax=Pikeienuella sp. TaxID=2831957 RepID=UPI00391C461F
MTEPRLYLLTPPLSEGASFAPLLDAALSAAPCACVRLRFAAEEEGVIRAVADPLREVCLGHDVALVLTDHFRLARQLGLDGAHLANPRLSVREARKALGEEAIVGAHAGASRHMGMTLAEAGADYVSLGPVAESALGAGEIAEQELFEWWAEAITTPSVAEGGMTLALAEALAPHADFIAAGAAIWSHPEGPAAGARAFAALLD